MRKIIPPYLFLGAVLGMSLIHYVAPKVDVIDQPYNTLGIFGFIIGLVMAIVVGKMFKKQETEIHTFRQPRKLVTTGLFRYSRNPIYLGFVISLIGYWIFLGSLLTGIIPFAFIAITDLWYIKYEERVMEKKFGDDYLMYKKMVRRWL